MGLFSGGKGGGEEVTYGYKGKEVTGHLLVDGYGSSIALIATGAHGDERKQIIPLINRVQNRWKHRNLIPIFEADKGYDSESLREALLIRGIFPWICRRKKPGQKAPKKIRAMIKRKRWQVERAISWLQRKFRKVVIRWERKMKYWKGFLTPALIKFWIDKLVG